MPHDVFISYSHEDKLTADAVCARLEAKGIRCWIAPRDVTPGVEYGESILDGISESRVLVLIFSGNSNQSTHVHREIERAVSKELMILPFRIENVPLSKSLEYFISAPHWMDALTDPVDEHIDQLAATVAILLARKGGGRERATPQPEPLDVSAEPLAVAPVAPVAVSAPVARAPTAVTTTAATPSWPQTHIGVVLGAIAGGVLVVGALIALVLVLTRAGPTSSPTVVSNVAQAGAPCANPTNTACALQFGAPVHGVLAKTDDTQTWFIDVPPGTDFWITLTDLPADYDLEVRGPNGYSESSGNSGTADDVVQINRSAGGRYQAQVSAWINGSPAPYTLLATRGAVAPTPALAIPTPTNAIPLGAAASSSDACAAIGTPRRVLALGQTGSDALTSAERAETWILSVPRSGGVLHIELGNLGVDYDLFVKMPNASCTSSTNSGTAIDVVDIRNPPAGIYFILVSAAGDTSPRPYSLSAAFR